MSSPDSSKLASSDAASSDAESIMSSSSAPKQAADGGSKKRPRTDSLSGSEGGQSEQSPPRWTHPDLRNRKICALLEGPNVRDSDVISIGSGGCYGFKTMAECYAHVRKEIENVGEKFEDYDVIVKKIEQGTLFGVPLPGAKDQHEFQFFVRHKKAAEADDASSEDEGERLLKFMQDEMQDDTAREPYTNQGRTDQVKDVLKAYGFTKEDWDGKNKKKEVGGVVVVEFLRSRKAKDVGRCCRDSLLYQQHRLPFSGETVAVLRAVRASGGEGQGHRFQQLRQGLLYLRTGCQGPEFPSRRLLQKRENEDPEGGRRKARKRIADIRWITCRWHIRTRAVFLQLLPRRSGARELYLALSRLQGRGRRNR